MFEVFSVQGFMYVNNLFGVTIIVTVLVWFCSFRRSMFFNCQQIEDIGLQILQPNLLGLK